MKKMNSRTAMDIIHKYSGKEIFNDDETAEFSEALEFMLEEDETCRCAWMYNLGSFYSNIGEYDLAIKYFNLCLSEKSFVAYLGLGDLYIKMKEYHNAFDCYTKARQYGFQDAAGYINDLVEEQAFRENEEFL